MFLNLFFIMNCSSILSSCSNCALPNNFSKALVIIGVAIAIIGAISLAFYFTHFAAAGLLAKYQISLALLGTGGGIASLGALSLIIKKCAANNKPHALPEIIEETPKVVVIEQASQDVVVIEQVPKEKKATEQAPKTDSTIEIAPNTQTKKKNSKERIFIPLEFSKNSGHSAANIRAIKADRKVNTQTCMSDFSIIEGNPDFKIAKTQAVAMINSPSEGDFKARKSIAVMVGMAVGDAIGAPFEFLPFNKEGYSKKNAKVNMKPNPVIARAKKSPNILENAKEIFSGYHDRFGLRFGQWTDDASMGACLADNLIQYEGLNGAQLMWSFFDWCFFGYNNAFTVGKRQVSVGMGGNVGQAFEAFKSTKDLFIRTINGTFKTTAGDKNTSGNGSLMRNGPVALIATSAKEAQELAMEQSYVTHQGEEAAACCALMALIIFSAINLNTEPKEIKELLLEKIATFNCDIESVNLLAKSGKSATEDWNWNSEDFTFNATRLKNQPGYIGSYAMDGLAMALHCIFTTNTFEDAVLKAATKGGDADTLAAITAQMAAAIYGLEAIPKDWIDALHVWDRQGEFAAKGLILNNIREAKIEKIQK